MLKKLYKVILSVMLLALVILLVGCGGNKNASVEQAKTPEEKSVSKIDYQPANSTTTKPDTTPEPVATTEPDSTLKQEATPEPASDAILGYLLDGHCAKTGVDDETGKVNVKKSPEKHTTSCLKLDMCMAEGIGITVKQTDGTYKYYQFDKDGAKKADDTIMMMTTRKFNNKISIKGTLEDNTITLSTIKEVQ